MSRKRLVVYIYGAVLLNACGKSPTNLPHGSLDSSIVEIEKTRTDYLPLTRGLLDQDTFVSTADGHCDSLLFTTLFLSAGGEGVDLKRAKDNSGLWERHPRRDCGSTISKDMYMGLFTYLWHAKDLSEVKSLISAGEVHNWVMGDGPAGEVVLTPNLVSTLYEMRFRLGGSDGLGRRLYSDKFEGKGLTGFQAHLQVLHILLRGSLLGAVTDLQKDRLAEHALRSPRNVLFQAAYHRYLDGDQADAVALFPAFCPAGHLPTSADRCDDYLWQRDDEPRDWAPCPRSPDPEKGFTGVDCELAAAVIEGML